MSPHHLSDHLSGNGTALTWEQVSITPTAFDRLTEYQALLERAIGRRVTNSEALDHIILSCLKP